MESMETKNLTNRIGILGHVFSDLTVIGYGRPIGSQSTCICRCICGTVKTIITQRVRTGNAKSCGCRQKFWQEKMRVSHGHSFAGRVTRTYRCWIGMKSRCSNKNLKRYPDYGGRGIKVCQRWMKFENFLKDMGEKPKGMSIERTNNNGNYEPGNCTWATPPKQASNRRTNIFVLLDGERLCATHAAKKLGVCNRVFHRRIHRDGANAAILWAKNFTRK